MHLIYKNKLIQKKDNVLNVDVLRDDFPVLQRKVNDRSLVYFDNAATTQKPNIVISATNDFYTKYNSNVHRGIHTLSQEATAEYENVRTKIAGFINSTSSKEIIFCKGTTDAINLVAHSYVKPLLQKDDEILIGGLEHHSNIVPWQIIAKMCNAKLKVIHLTKTGELDLKDFDKLFTKRTKFLALNHVSNALGTISPVKKMIEIAHSHNVLVLLDGAQAVAHTKVDVKDLGCDFYAFSGHKMYGPTGIGALYGKIDLLNSMEPYQGGGEMISYVTYEETEYSPVPYKFEAGTPNIAGVVGLGAAISYLQKLGMENIVKYEEELLNYLNEKMLAIDGLRLIGEAKEKISIFSFIMDNIHPHDLGTILDNDAIAIRSGHHCAMPIMDYFGIPATARVSLSFYNTKHEIDLLIDSLQRAKKVFS